MTQSVMIQGQAPPPPVSHCTQYATGPDEHGVHGVQGVHGVHGVQGEH